MPPPGAHNLDSPVTDFHAPDRSFGSVGPAAAASLVSAAADVALVLDGAGVIRDVSVSNEEDAPDGYRKWVGRPWVDTVTVESRAKVAELLSDATKKRARRWRQLNHTSTRGADVPVLYSAVPLDQDGGVVAIGRDLRSIATLQQQLVEAQQSMERDYLRLRHLETRYRLLFRLASEAVLIVDAQTQRVLEANPAAARLVGESGKRLIGRVFGECFTVRTRPGVVAMLGRVPAAGRSEEVEAKLAGGQGTLTVSASLFRQDGSTLFLVRLLPDTGAAGASANPERSMLLTALESIPDGFVVTDLDGRILSANSAFLEMTQLTSQEQLRGQSLGRWLGRTGIDLSVLVANLRQQGSVRLFATTLRGQYDAVAQVEISATCVAHDEHPCLGLVVRDVGRRLQQGPDMRRELPRSVSDLTKLVGRVPLKDIVGETTDLIEKMCIEAALELTRDNRASAAEMLGLSRQSLYVKLRRFGIGDLGDADA